jgi:iron complex transport system ATP-binding protein
MTLIPMLPTTIDGTALMEAKALKVGYGEHIVIRDASFSVTIGSMLVVLGSNGCGKTTILKTCVGLLPALAGSAQLGGKNVAAMSPRQRARTVAWVPQVAEAAWSYRSRDIVAQGRYSLCGPFKAFGPEDEMAIDGALEAMDAAAFASRPFSSLSGGEARRVLIARALAQQTPLLVLDEPTAHLDPGRQMELMELLKSLSKAGKAIVVSVHDVNAARRYADMALLVGRDGSAVFGTPDGILTNENLEIAYDTNFIHGDHATYGKFVLPVSRKRRSVS